MLPITTLGRRLWTAFKAAAEPVGQYMRLYHHIPMPVLNLVLLRMLRLVGRFDRLVLKWERDQLSARPTPRVRAKRAASPHKMAAADLQLLGAPVALPTRFGWLQKMVPAAHMGAGYLDYMLQETDSETRALVAAAPQAGRILRPLCRILGTPIPDWLALPKRPRKPRTPQPPKPRATPSARGERQGPARGFTRRQIDQMSVAELLAHYGKLPPHFPLPIRNLNYIRRKIAAG
jgi:hypothetical protein